MKIHLGVIDMPEPEGGTTYSVATILEEKYGLFSNFVDFGLLDLEDILTDSLNDALATMMAGGPKDANPFSDAMADIERIFKQEYLAQQGVEHLGIPGVPTKAALEGKSIRFKRRKGPRRPSFIDSGTLQSSFKAWTE